MRRLAPAALLFAVIGFAAPAALLAQETQVPLDQDGELLEIDRRLAQRLGLLVDEYPQLQVARLYQLDDDAYVLEVTFQQDGRSSRQRAAMTGAQVRDFRARVSAALMERAPEVVLDQDGRFLLMGTTTLLGVGYYGWALPLVLDMQSGRAILATYMLTAGASFAVPYFYTDNRPVTYGMANAGFWGATRGVVHGTTFANATFPEGHYRTYVGLGMGMSLAEGLAAYSWARAVDMTAGQAHTIGNYGDYGYAWAGYLMTIIQPSSSRVSSAASLAGSATALGFGASRRPQIDHTWGDAEVQRLGFYLGSFNALAAFDLLFDDPSADASRALGGLLIAGSAAGLFLGERQASRRDYSAGEGILVDLATVAGGLLGTGVGVLIGGEADATLFLTLAALGADGAFAFAAGQLGEPAVAAGESDGDARRGARNLDFELNPGALMMLRSGGAAAAPEGIPVPLLSVRYRF